MGGLIWLETGVILAGTEPGSHSDGDQGNDRSGEDVATSEDGGIVAALSPGDADSGQGSHVDVYARQGDGAWKQWGDPVMGDDSFHCVAARLSKGGTTLAVLGSTTDGNSQETTKGHIRVYAWSDQRWVAEGQDIPVVAKTKNHYLGGFDLSGPSWAAVFRGRWVVPWAIGEIIIKVGFIGVFEEQIRPAIDPQGCQRGP